jgi:acyl carrier protein
MLAADATLYDEAGQELLQVEDFYMRKVDAASIAGTVTAGGSEEPAASAISPDGSAISPDASTISPDADAISPDASAISPDASAISPDASAISPDADAISPAAGAEAFRRLVNAKITPQIVVSAMSIDAAIAASRRADYAALARQGVAGDAAANGEMSPVGAAGSQTEREAAVAEILHRLLGTREIGLTDDFFDVGGDSLLASQFIAFVRGQFGIRIPLRRFFADPTITGIAALIDELFAAPPAAGADVR